VHEALLWCRSTTESFMFLVCVPQFPWDEVLVHEIVAKVPHLEAGHGAPLQELQRTLRAGGAAGLQGEWGHRCLGRSLDGIVKMGTVGQEGGRALGSW